MHGRGTYSGRAYWTTHRTLLHVVHVSSEMRRNWLASIIISGRQHSIGLLSVATGSAAGKIIRIHFVGLLLLLTEIIGIATTAAAAKCGSTVKTIVVVALLHLVVVRLSVGMTKTIASSLTGGESTVDVVIVVEVVTAVHELRILHTIISRRRCHAITIIIHARPRNHPCRVGLLEAIETVHVHLLLAAKTRVLR